LTPLLWVPPNVLNLIIPICQKSSPQQPYPNYYDGGHGPGPPYFGNGPPDGPQLNRLTGGVKVPDENLTPQQRHHREEQLARLRKLQQVLIPENDHPGTPGDPNCHPIQPHENSDGYNHMQPVRFFIPFIFHVIWGFE